MNVSSLAPSPFKSELFPAVNLRYWFDLDVTDVTYVTDNVIIIISVNNLTELTIIRTTSRVVRSWSGCQKRQVFAMVGLPKKASVHQPWPLALKL